MEFLLSIPLVVVIIALFAGTALLLLECFVPGIGIPGITGGILVLFAIVALVPHIGWYVVLIALAVVLLIILAVSAFAKSAGRGQNPLVLDARTDRDSGFSANNDCRGLINKEGISVTQLRPAGIALIDGNRVDVVTDGEFIEVNVPVKVVDIEGRRIIVKKIEGGNK